MSSTTAISLAAERETGADRRETASFGMWVFVASEAMFFGGLFFAYIYGRMSFPEGFAAAGRATDVVIGTANTAVLLTSSFLVALAVTAGDHGRQRWTVRLLAGAALLGIVFLALKGVEYRNDWQQGLFPGLGFHLAARPGPAPAGAELFYMLYFTMTGVHALHLTIGIVWTSALALGVRRNPAVWFAPSRLEVAGLYWHFVDVIWILLYPLIYLVSRSA
jgi:cytochrome c oxidase subunit 3